MGLGRSEDIEFQCGAPLPICARWMGPLLVTAHQDASDCPFFADKGASAPLRLVTPSPPTVPDPCLTCGIERAVDGMECQGPSCAYYARREAAHEAARRCVSKLRGLP